MLVEARHSGRLLATTLVVMSFLAPVRASAVERWYPIGPEGGFVASITTDPVEPTIVFATADDGAVFKSRDGGISWARRSRGIEARVLGITVDSAAPSTLYAATSSGVFKSTTGGASWEPTGSELRQSRVAKVVILPGSRSTIFALVDLGGVWKSTDSGGTWTHVDGLPSYADELAVAATTPPTLFVAADYVGLLESNDAGATWHELYDLVGRCWRVAPDPHRPHRLLLAVTEGLFLGDDEGRSLTRVAPGKLPVFDPSNPGVVYASWGGTPILRSNDGGVTWRELEHTLDVLAVAPSGVVYARSPHAVARSVDGGRTWRSHRHGLYASPAIGLAVTPSPRPVVHALISASLLRTADDGRRWMPTLPAVSIQGIAMDPTAPSTIYAATGESPEEPYGRVAKSTDAGDTWTYAVVPGADEGVDYGVTVDPGDPHIAYAGISQDARGGVARSDDGGGTWHDFYDPTGFRVSSWAVDPVNRGRLYVGYGGVSLSEDFGETWNASGIGLPADSNVTALAIDPGNPDLLYAGLSSIPWAPGGVRGLYRSDDGSATWHVLAPGLADRDVRSIVVDASNGTIYAGTDRGVVRSEDGGFSWSSLNDGEDALDVAALALSAGHVYAATSGGIYRLGDAQATTTPGGVRCRRALTSQAARLRRDAVAALRRCLDRLTRAEAGAADECERRLDVAHDGTLIASKRARRSQRLARRCRLTSVHDLGDLLGPRPLTMTDAVDRVLDDALRAALGASGEHVCEALGAIGLGRVCGKP